MPTLIYIHIPKTAGTAMRNFLHPHFVPEEVYQVGESKQYRQGLVDMPSAQRDSLKLVFGHICFGWHELLTQDCIYTTLLRNPVERIVSLYYYIRSSGNHYLHKETEGMRLYDFVTSKISMTMDNGMVRQLCQDEDFMKTPYADMKLPFGSLNYNHLNEAKLNLELYFPIVGTVEQLPDYMSLLCRTMGWEVATLPIENKVPHPPMTEIDAKTLTAIEDIVQLDMELYKFTERLANEKAASLLRGE